MSVELEKRSGGEALKHIRHALILSHGLLATDRQGVLMDTDANKNTCWQIDHENELSHMDDAESAIRMAISAIDKTIREFDIAGKPLNHDALDGNYVCRIYLGTARAALTAILEAA